MKKRFIIIIFLCIAFIYFHSMIPEGQSAKESIWFTTNVLNPILSWFGLKVKKDVVRKFAHTVEFGVLSIIISLRWKPIRTFYAGFSLAFLDESLQILTGRGALITDIWIDLIGVGIGVIIGCIIKRRRWKKNKWS